MIHRVDCCLGSSCCFYFCPGTPGLVHLCFLPSFLSSFLSFYLFLNCNHLFFIEGNNWKLSERVHPSRTEVSFPPWGWYFRPRASSWSLPLKARHCLASHRASQLGLNLSFFVVEFSRSLRVLSKVSCGFPVGSKLLLLLLGVLMLSCGPNSVQSGSHPMSDAFNEARYGTPQAPIGLTQVQDWPVPWFFSKG